MPKHVVMWTVRAHLTLECNGPSLQQKRPFGRSGTDHASPPESLPRSVVSKRQNELTQGWVFSATKPRASSMPNAQLNPSKIFSSHPHFQSDLNSRERAQRQPRRKRRRKRRRQLSPWSSASLTERLPSSRPMLTTSPSSVPGRPPGGPLARGLARLHATWRVAAPHGSRRTQPYQARDRPKRKVSPERLL